MYLNDPILYGATLPYSPPYTPYADVQTPFMNQFVPPHIAQWQKFLPYQQLPMQFPFQQFQQFTPYMHGSQFTPFFHNYNLPYNYNVPNYNVPFYGWQRPGIF